MAVSLDFTDVKALPSVIVHSPNGDQTVTYARHHVINEAFQKSEFLQVLFGEPRARQYRPSKTYRTPPADKTAARRCRTVSPRSSITEKMLKLALKLFRGWLSSQRRTGT
ncbi:hypothetical protein [Pseudomonas fluorescens]|uniref:hypothetical protein n=1 Tax=Pseudomonas fluorescens TaxID=294 RepID=UPI0005EAECFF|nr:hypothetical protein [Pseudomonas fluorescens]